MESGPVTGVSSLNAHDVPTPLSATTASRNAMLSFFIILTPLSPLPTPAEHSRVSWALSILAKIVLGVTSPALMSSEGRIRLDQQEGDDRRDCVLVYTPHPETLAYSTSSSW